MQLGQLTKSVTFLLFPAALDCRTASRLSGKLEGSPAPALVL